jgi:flagellar assembly factor FliW
MEQIGAILEFPAGLPGFEDRKRFGVIERANVAPIVLLQSLDLPDLCFLAAPVAAIDPAYQLDVSSEDLARLGLERQNDQLVCLAILSAPENGPLTANLLAPVVIEPRTRRAVQAVRMDSRYSHQHPLDTPGAASCL